MNYGELRTLFHGLLNRNDCTDTLADSFIALGLRRVERLLRTPLQKVSYSYVIPADWDGTVAIPSDYLGMSRIRINEVPIDRITIGQVANFSGEYGFYIDGGSFYFKGLYTEGDSINFIYYGEFDSSVADATITNYTLVLPDLTVYSALVFAADYFIDARKAGYESTLTALVQEVQMMSDNEEISTGMAMTPYGGGII